MKGIDVVAELRKYERVTGAEREKLKEDLQRRYAAGESMRQLASSTGRSYGFVHRLLEESGVTRRPRGGKRGRKDVAATA
ncbi:helix-turn-helix domain-containing protein [Streptosporangium sandarakinum]|uniref:helix-turn-helix domain-containing protein n=1 Tax=Streptosporangium sandarakinum TaxID=1260955 RepID=UPI0037B17B6D